MNGIAGREEHVSSARAEFGSPEGQRSVGASLFLKRMFDIGVAGGLLVALFPLLAITALLVFASLGRPLMFRQERCGKGRRSFVVGKFRTMSNATDHDGTLLPDKQRQTLVTAFLRRIRVDELPQLHAVLRGDMSFVGPRPLPPEVIADFGAAGEHRSALAPGMTGWAQVNGNTLLTNEQKIALDIWYVDERSLWLDIQIVCMTLRTIIFGEAVNAANVRTALSHLDHTLPRGF